MASKRGRFSTFPRFKYLDPPPKVASKLVGHTLPQLWHLNPCLHTPWLQPLKPWIKLKSTHIMCYNNIEGHKESKKKFQHVDHLKCHFAMGIATITSIWNFTSNSPHISSKISDAKAQCCLCILLQIENATNKTFENIQYPLV